MAWAVGVSLTRLSTPDVAFLCSIAECVVIEAKCRVLALLIVVVVAAKTVVVVAKRAAATLRARTVVGVVVVVAAAVVVVVVERAISLVISSAADSIYLRLAVVVAESRRERSRGRGRGGCDCVYRGWFFMKSTAVWVIKTVRELHHFLRLHFFRRFANGLRDV